MPNTLPKTAKLAFLLTMPLATGLLLIGMAMHDRLLGGLAGGISLSTLVWMVCLHMCMRHIWDV